MRNFITLTINYLNLRIMKKISLKNTENALSRNEMKTIMAGRMIATPECGEECSSDSFCSGNSSCGCCNSGKCGA
jgi:hypothetical protein